MVLSVPDPIAATGVVAIVRGLSPVPAVAVVEVLFAAGVRAVEITLDSPEALTSLKRVAAALPTDAAVGAGTVLSSDDAQRAVEAGASFLVAPVLDPALVAAAGVPIFPGAMTPTEIRAAWQAGAAAVKLFPAGSLGPRFLREVRAPLAGIPIIPTGGINADNAGDWMDAGAVAVGAGGWLIGDADPDGVRARAGALLAAVGAEGRRS
jgi:2-dehydro-3-deoxyphosphogluconate aldolase/(4S)-4-hydroxy-2-oxoglutarate aldolase